MVSTEDSQLSDKPAPQHPLKEPLRFYRKRSRFYTGLLLFVVVIGLPIVAMPSLRNRLSARIQLFKNAVAGNVSPVVAQAGANQEPFPSEYEKSEPPVRQAFKLPPPENVARQAPGLYVPAPSAPSNPASSALNIVGSPGRNDSEESAESREARTEASDESGPIFQQGAAERGAYDLLLQSNPKISEMVQGGDPSLSFISWDAAHRGADIYWVRLKFRSKDNPDREYIWQVNLDSKEITPLSYHARSIS